MVTLDEMAGVQGGFLHRLGCFPVNQDHPGTASLRLALDLLGKGEQVVVFPEGRIQRRDGPITLQQGLARLAQMAKATDGLTGAEIAALVPDALYSAFADGERQITAADLIDAAKTVVPLSKTAAEKIERLRQWAAGRARPATTPETTRAATATTRNLDL